MSSGCHYVYILHCSDGSYYVGHTQDTQNRLREHNAGEGATWTCARRPVRLVYTEEHSSLEKAVQREAQLKRWSRAKKEALIRGDLEGFKALSKKKRL